MHYYPVPEDVIEMDEVISAVKTAFIDHGTGSSVMPPKVYVPLPGGDFRTMPSYLPSLDIAGVKIVNVHPDNRSKGLLTVMALTVLLEPQTGKPTAIMNATKLTDLRTGASAAVATEALSRKRNGILGIIGSGKQADAGLHALLRVFDAEEIKVWSRTEKHAGQFVSRMKEYPVTATSLADASDADVLLTVTTSSAPLIRDEWIHEGTHINAMGADAPGKQELDPKTLARAQVFVDDYEQAIHSGEINVPCHEGLYSRDQISGTLGDVLSGRVKRNSPDAITIFDSTGLSITDLAIAALVPGKGKHIELPFHFEY